MVSHRRSLLKGLAVHRVLYQSILNAKLTGRNWVGKGAQATGMTTSLRILSSKADSNTWESFSASRVTTLRRLQEKGYQATSETETTRATSILPGLRRKRTGLLLSGPKSSFQIKVNFAFHLEIKVWRKTGEAQNPSCLKSSVKFPKSVMIWGAVTSAGVGPLCFIKSKVNAAVYQEILEHFMLPSADKLYGDADLLF